MILIAVAGPGTAAADPEVLERTPSFAEAETLSGYFFGAHNSFDAAYDRVQKWKKDHRVPIGFGAHHWWHFDRDERIYGNGYGVPGRRGTYFYFATFDPSAKLPGNDHVSEIGFHNETRFRVSGDKVRSFYDDTVWIYETYAYAKTGLGRLKAGQIVQDFGIAWDNSWWEAVPFFDGMRANPAWGLSWDNSWSVSSALKVGTTVQYFITDDLVSGAIPGANAEASPPLEERNTFNIRLVPEWQLTDDTTLALGISAFTRQIDDKGLAGVDARQTAYALDATYTWGNLSLYGQYTRSDGVITPARYVSGGPSDRQTSFEVGANYKFGPVAARFNYSEGWDDNPSGRQFIINPGLTFQIAKGVTAYAEYVRWDVTDSAGTTTKYDDGYEFIIVWNY